MSRVGGVFTTQMLPSDISPDETAAPYLDYRCWSEYAHDEGLEQLPVCGGPGTPCKIVRLYAPTEYRVVTWVVRRLGAKPQAPAKESSDPNEVYARGTRGGATPTTGPDGKTQIWTLAGQYLYFLRVPRDESLGLPLGSGPYSKTPAAANVVPKSNFKPAF